MNYLYTVAGHTFKLLLPDDLSEVEWLVPYIPFEEKREVDFLFTLEIKNVPLLRCRMFGGICVASMTSLLIYGWTMKVLCLHLQWMKILWVV